MGNAAPQVQHTSLRLVLFFRRCPSVSQWRDAMAWRRPFPRPHWPVSSPASCVASESDQSHKRKLHFKCSASGQTNTWFVFQDISVFFVLSPRSRMFYKIKSRNAHMKIHRQPQEDWTERQLQHQLITHRLALSHATNLTATTASTLLSQQPPALTFSASGLAGTTSNNSNTDNDLHSVAHGNAITPRNVGVLDPSSAVTYSNIAASNSHVITHIDAGDSSQREATTVLPFHQSWASFGHSPDPVALYCNTDGKEHVGAGTAGGKEPINWH